MLLLIIIFFFKILFLFIYLFLFICFVKAKILGEVSGEDLNRIFISFPSVSFQGHGPDAGHGIASSGFVAFLGLEMKHN